MKEFPKLLISNKKGNIQYLPEFQAVGMKGVACVALEPEELIPLHPDSELFMLPDRVPIGFDPINSKYIPVSSAVFDGKIKTCYAVSAFMAPGYTATYNAAYHETSKAKILPLFSYSAVAYYKGGFYVTGMCVDREKRQVLANMDLREIKNNVKVFRRMFPENRLMRHLETCALCYGCPAAKNFFLQRYEGPLPASSSCNALCLGCISYQEDKKCPVTQPRIKFTPTPEEIAQTAIFHIKNSNDPVVSFGQGCEGEPLMVADTLIQSVKLIRETTSKGIINLNTNASKPKVVETLFMAGLNSIRVSMNSVRKKYYELYYRPIDYSFQDVLHSIKNAKKHNGFVSINYLVMPGFTDNKKELVALLAFLEKYDIDMIQWRNLNYDPLKYFETLKIKSIPSEMVGIDIMIENVKKEVPKVMHGYFNPSKGRMRRARKKWQVASGK